MRRWWGAISVSIPLSRKVRIVLGEKCLAIELCEERPRERRDALAALNPAGEVPVLVEPDGAAVADSAAICEFLDEVCPEPPLLGTDPMARARAAARALAFWHA